MFRKSKDELKKTDSDMQDEKNENISKKRKRDEKISKNKKPKTSNVIVYWDCIYRSTTDISKLFGKQVHISKGELGYIPGEKDYGIIPFSHMDGSGALFEMEEKEEDTLGIIPKSHQPGTGITDLSEEEVIITRIFYDPSQIKKECFEQINKLGVELVKINLINLLTEDVDKIKVKVKNERPFIFKY